MHDQNHYDRQRKGFLPKDFMELGSQFSMGSTAENTIHRSWKPFGTIGFALNNHNNIGTSLSFGVSGSVKGADILNISFDYNKGINAISEPSYGVHLDYKF